MPSISSSTAVATDDGASTTAHSAFTPEGVTKAIHQIRESIDIVVRHHDGARGLAISTERPVGGQVVGTLPPLYPEWLGDQSFCRVHGVRFPYVAGEMANGIATTRMVIAMARAGMMGFFGAGGLGFERVEQAVDELATSLHDLTNWGVNLIHSPSEPVLEERVADLLLRRGVPIVSASAFMDLTPAVVRLAAVGLRTGPDGRVVRRTRMFAKVSRPEIAEKFMSPAPTAMLDALVSRGLLTAAEATLAARVPVAEDVTVEADSGGHTDNRPLVSLLPAIMGSARRLRGEVRVCRRDPGRRRWWVGHSGRGRRRVRTRRFLRRHRIGEPGVGGGGTFRGREIAAGTG